MARKHVISLSSTSSRQRVHWFTLLLGLFFFRYATNAFVMPSFLGHRVQNRMGLNLLRRNAEGEDVTETKNDPVVERRKFEEFKVGDEVDAIIVSKNSVGTFCGINAEKPVLLSAQRSLCELLTLRERVKAKIKTVDLEKRQASIEIPDLQELVQGRKKAKTKKNSPPPVKKLEQTKSVADGIKVTRGPNSVEISGLDLASVDVDYENGIVQISVKSTPAGSEVKPTKKKEKEKEVKPTKEKAVNPEAVEAMKRMEVGQAFSGKVTNKNSFGVWVDVGSAGSAKLRRSDSLLGDKLHVGEEVKFKVVDIDVAKGHCSVEVEDIETLVAGRPARTEMSTLEVGSVHVGHISRVSRSRVFADIGCVKEGRLKTSDLSCQLGQEVKVKVAGVDLEKGRFLLEPVN